MVKNFRSRMPRWLPGKVTETIGPLSYRVELHTGRLVRCHVDQIRAHASDHQPTACVDDSWDLVNTPAATDHSESQEQRQLPRRSQRISHPPDRYIPSVWEEV